MTTHHTTPQIRFPAVVSQIRTLSDGGIRVTLDLPEDAIMQMAQLAECKRVGALLSVECEAIVRKSLTELDDETEKSAEGNGSKVDRRRSTNRRDQR